MRVDAPQGPCWRRYNHDGYGEQKGGGPFLTYGQGRAWPLLTGERAHYELAAGKEVKPFIEAMEGFASPGGMLPEQIWDQRISLQTSAGPVVLGDPAGSAMPLVWAHAEYLKLVRSARDGRVFDRIAAVEARYGAGPVASAIEVWKMRRPIPRLASGKTLRVLAADPFQVLYTTDQWVTQRTLTSLSLGPAGSAVDIPTAAGQSLELSFTLYWSKTKSWEGRNFSVKITAETAAAPSSAAPQAGARA